MIIEMNLQLSIIANLPEFCKMNIADSTRKSFHFMYGVVQLAAKILSNKRQNINVTLSN